MNKQGGAILTNNIRRVRSERIDSDTNNYCESQAQPFLALPGNRKAPHNRHCQNIPVNCYDDFTQGGFYE